MSSILYLTHRLPYPPNKGDKIRSFHLLKYLSADNKIYLGTLIDDAQDWQYVNEAKKYCQDTCIVSRQKPIRLIPRLLTSLVSLTPLSNALFYDAKLQTWVKHILATKKIDKVLVFSSQMAQYVVGLVPKEKLLIDFVDVDSLKFKAYGDSKRGPMRWIYKLESKKLSRFEQVVARTSKVNYFVSEDEAQAFKPTKDIHVKSMSNGIDCEYFNPQLTYENPYNPQDKIIVFTGMMDYWPNIEAVNWFVKEVMPLIRERLSSVKFYIVGGNPNKEVKKLQNDNDVLVTGRVEDIRPYLKYAHISVVPLFLARGIQNKVLEALSMNLPVIASSMALQGLCVENAPAVFCANEKDEWLNFCIQLLQNTNLSHLNHEFVKRHYSWETALSVLKPELDNRVSS